MCSLGGQEPDAGDEVLSPRLRSESISASTLSSHPGPHMQLSSAGSPAAHPASQRMAGHHVARSPAPGDTTYTNAARRRIRPVSAGDSPELTDSPPGSGQAHLFTLGAVNLVRSVGREVLCVKGREGCHLAPNCWGREAHCGVPDCDYAPAHGAEPPESGGHPGVRRTASSSGVSLLETRGLRMAQRQRCAIQAPSLPLGIVCGTRLWTWRGRLILKDT